MFGFDFTPTFTHTQEIPQPTQRQPMTTQATPYVLHRPPMLLIDNLIHHDDDSATAQLRVRDDLMFYEAAGLPTWVSIELMAQTISLYAGVQSNKQGIPPRLGFLLGTRKLVLPFSHFAPDSVLTILAKRHYIHDNLGVFDCSIYVGDDSTPAMVATISVYEPSDNEMPPL